MLQDGIRAYALTSAVQIVGKLMVMKFVTEMHDSKLYNPTTSVELFIFSYTFFF